MAFFDDIGKKITQAGTGALQKTKEMADVARINGLISDEEKRVNNAFYQIGKLYVTLHGDNCEPDFTALVESIRESEAKIADLKQQVQIIRGVKRCSSCGAEIASNVAFCNSCGARAPEAPAPVVADNLVQCSGCGKMVKPEMAFCTGCGASMKKEPQFVPIAAVVNEPPAMPFICPSCGKETDADSDFCMECGFKLK